MGEIKTVIFDWSGVLCDDFETVYKAEMAVFEAFGLKRLSPEEYRQVAELPWTEFYRKRGITDVEKITEVFLKAFYENDSSKPMEGALDALKQLHGKGIKMAVLSAKHDAALQRECREFGFDGFIGAIESRNDKRDSINGLIEKLGRGKESVLFVGDMQHDVETARHAGIKIVAVLSGYTPREKVLAARPDYAIESIAELPALIKKLNGESA